VDKNRKEQIVKDLNSTLNNSSVLLLCHYHGVTVSEVNKLRFKAKEASVGISVVKNTLSRLAIKGTEFEIAESEFKGATMLVYADDIVQASKIVVSFAKENEFFKILSGCFDDALLDEGAVVNLSQMPSLDELRSSFIALLQTPASRLVTITQEPAACLARVLKSYSNQTN
jgi:large subunit ribosomal protein L10